MHSGFQQLGWQPADAFFVRPNNNAGYVEHQAIGSADTCLLKFTQFFIAEAASGTLTGLRIALNAPGIVAPEMGKTVRAHLFSVSPSSPPAGDQAVFNTAILDEASKLGYVDFSVWTSGGSESDTVESYGVIVPNPFPITAAAGASDLYAILEVTSATLALVANCAIFVYASARIDVAAQSWSAEGAVLDLDFARNRASVNGSAAAIGSLISVSRNTFANRINQDGSLSPVSANIARLSCDELLNEPAGLLIEGALAHQAVQSADMSNARPGVLGVDGELPDGWSTSFFPPASDVYVSTISNITGTGFTLRLQNSAPTSTNFLLRSNQADNAAFTPAETSPGDQWTGSFWLKVAPGSVPLPDDNSLSIAILFYDSAFNLIVDFSAIRLVRYLSTDRTWVVEARTGPAGAPVGAAYAQLAFVYNQVNSSAIDITVIVENFSLEKNDFRTTAIAAASRAADDVTLPDFATYISAPPWSLVVTADAPRVANPATLLELSDGSPANYLALYLDSNHVLQFRSRRASGVPVDTALGRIPALSRFTVALSVSTGSTVIAFNGKPSIAISLTVPANLGMLTFGGGQSGLGYWFGFIGRATFYASALPAGTLQEHSLRDLVYFDDFSYADGPLTATAPTKQAYSQFGLISYVSGQQLVSPPPSATATAAYTQIVGRQPPRMAMALLRWGGTGAAAALVGVQQNNPKAANDTAVHPVFAQSLATWGIAVNGVLSETGAFGYNYPLAMQVGPEYSIGWGLNGNAMIYLAPGGELIRLVHHFTSAEFINSTRPIINGGDFSTSNGRYFFIEHFMDEDTSPLKYIAVAQR